MIYTNVKRFGDNILLRGINETGRKINKKIPYKPRLFIESNNSDKYDSIYGVKLVERSFDSISKCNEYAEEVKDIENITVYGTKDYVCQYMDDEYQNKK
jgi:hypothetical protein